MAVRRPSEDSERRLLAFIADFIRMNGYAPSITEMGLGTGINSRGGIASILNRLESKGYIRRYGEVPRAVIEVMDHGTGYAGKSGVLLMFDTYGKVVSKVFVPAQTANRFLLKVSGDGLCGNVTYKGTRLKDGDVLLVDRDVMPEYGDVAVVFTDDGLYMAVNESGLTSRICGSVVGFFRQ